MRSRGARIEMPPWGDFFNPDQLGPMWWRESDEMRRTKLIDHVGFPVSDYPRSKAFYGRP